MSPYSLMFATLKTSLYFQTKMESSFLLNIQHFPIKKITWFLKNINRIPDEESRVNRSPLSASKSILKV